MSQDNVELLRQGLKSVDAFWELLDDHVVLDTRNYPALSAEAAAVHVGREAVIKTNRKYWGTWVDYHLDADELIDAGPSVVSANGVAEEAAAFRSKGDGRRSGRSVAAGSSVGCCSRTRRQPSKPWGCGSRRCRGRT